MKSGIILLSFLGMFLAISSPAKADRPSPWSDFTVVTENGKYIFVMLVPTEKTDQALSCGEAQHRPGIPDAAIRARYSQAGLYMNDGSSTPLWTVDWAAFEDQVWVHPEGHYLVRLGPWACASDFDELAIAFYEDGQELKHYSVRDIVQDTAALPHSVSHYRWMAKAEWNTWNNSFFALLTLTGDKHSFDIRTGRITRSESYPLIVEAEIVATQDEEALPHCGIVSSIVRREYRLTQINYGTSQQTPGQVFSVFVLCPELYPPAEIGQAYTLYLAGVEEQICPLWGKGFLIRDEVEAAYCAGEIY